MVNLDHVHCSSSRDNQESDSSQSVGNNKPRGEAGRGHKKSSESSSSETSARSGREHGHDDHDTDAEALEFLRGENGFWSRQRAQQFLLCPWVPGGTLKIRLRVMAESHQLVPISAAGLLGE